MADVGEEARFELVELLQAVGGAQAGLQLGVGPLQLGGALGQGLVGAACTIFLFPQGGQGLGLGLLPLLPGQVDAVGQAQRKQDTSSDEAMRTPCSVKTLTGKMFSVRR